MIQGNKLITDSSNFTFMAKINPSIDLSIMKFHILTYQNTENCKKILNYMLQKGTSSDILSQSYNLLYLAILINEISIDVFQIFLDLKNDPNSSLFDINFNETDEFGNTYLHYACFNNNLSLVKLLIEQCRVNNNILNKNCARPNNLSSSNSETYKYMKILIDHDAYMTSNTVEHKTEMFK